MTQLLLPVLSFASCAGIAASAFFARRAAVAQRERDRLHAQIDNLGEGVYHAALDRRIISANKALVRMNGYASEAEMLEALRHGVEPWYVDQAKSAEFHARLMRDGAVADLISETYRYKTREKIWITESARLILHERTGKPLYYEGSVRDITETMMRLSLEERFQRLTSELPGVLFQSEVTKSGTARFAYLSQSITKLTGHPHRAHMADPLLFRRLIHPDDLPLYDRTREEAAARQQPWEVECRLTAQDGTERWLRITASPQRGEVLTWHGYIADVTRRRQQEIQNTRLAFFDPLTHLPNRRRFIERMSEETGRAGPDAGSGVLLFIDLDNFKVLNDTQGHDVGDAYLVRVAERLNAAVGAGDMVARLGGDEFVVILGSDFSEPSHATRDAIRLGHRVLDALQEPFTLRGSTHIGSASIGLVVFDRNEERVDELMKRADLAMYQAKAAGRNRLALFDPASLTREAERFQLMAELRTAMGNGQLSLHFQPVVDDERQIVGAEALLRWEHPTRGIILPDQFLPVADQGGLSAELSLQVLRLGLAALERWQDDSGLRDLRLSLNFSARAFSSSAFNQDLRALLARHETSARRLSFELTETALAGQSGDVAGWMSEVKGLGIRLALDDFGTGSASIIQLKHLPIDEIKIDGSFVADIEASDGDRSLVKTILAMARTLRIRTVAEHVENPRQEAFLRAFGCNFFQGYLYAPPMAAGVFEDFVRQGRDLRPAPFGARQLQSA
ncbi:MAG: EAL domain-containing protein [Methylobacterium mesophilicum]|nr:EAL domain-containing protein [Methylobacterium mesophilicum]